MSAGRVAGDADVVTIEIVLLAVGAEKADGGLAILDLSREEGLLAEAIFHAGHGITLMRNAASQHPFLLPPRHPPP